VLKLRDQKITRFIGVTCHYDPEVPKTALERHDFDCTQMALNAGLVGMEKSKLALNKAMATSFEKVALPVAVRQKLSGHCSRKRCESFLQLFRKRQKWRWIRSCAIT
jgi:hypothetical protein